MSAFMRPLVRIILASAITFTVSAVIASTSPLRSVISPRNAGQLAGDGDLVGGLLCDVPGIDRLHLHRPSGGEGEDHRDSDQQDAEPRGRLRDG